MCDIRIIGIILAKIGLIRSHYTYKDFFSRLSKRYLLLFILFPVVFILVILLNYWIIISITKENIEYKANSTLLKYTRDLHEFLDPSIQYIKSISDYTEYMLAEGVSHEKIHAYLVRESVKLDSTHDIETTGIYGFIDGEFMDGANWIPDEDYIPTERPWYIESVEYDGELVFVTPYIDEMTGDTIMTFAKLLNDKVSVVALDCKMNEFQSIIARSNNDDDLTEVLVIDRNGTVIAHSDEAKVGTNFFNTDDIIDRMIARKLIEEEQMRFNVSYDDVADVVYADYLEGGWYVLSVTRESELFSRVITVFVISVVAGVIGTVLIFHIALMITIRRLELEDYNINLQSISNIYLLMFKIDLLEDTFEKIGCTSAEICDYVGDNWSNADSYLVELFKIRSDPASLPDVLEFADLNTLGNRLKDTDTITCEFMNKEKIWYRARFITAEKTTEGTLKSVLFAVEFIDEEKRARDRLKYLSETDTLTGINNRGSGENKIRRCLLDGEGGMFILLDIDRFKIYNDTYGHEVGDKVIIAVADALKRTFRDRDIVMRLGGDEFAAFVPCVTDRKKGAVIVERFIEEMSRVRVPEAGDREIQVSIGVAFCHGEECSCFEDVYHNADQCTYISKQNTGTRATYYN